MSKTNTLSQKEYLQKYLSGKKKDPKKKKKRQKVIGNGMKIIDDDLDLTKMRSLDENEIDLFMQGEDAPQVVGIVDERADEIKTLENFKQTNKWKLMSQDDGIESSIKIEQIATKKSNYDDDSDLSPPRNKNDDSDLSPDRNGQGSGRSSDLSPPRRKRRDIDRSPPRKIKQENRDSNSDLSPPRKVHKQHSKQANSPPRSKHERGRENKRHDQYNHTRHSKDDRKLDRSKGDGYKKRSRWGSESDKRDNTSQNRDDNSGDSDRRGEKMDKTLDGKRAGLQNAQELKNENDNFRQRENEMFSKLSEDLTGRNATAVKRHIKGRKKDTEEEIAAQKEREERQKVLEAKYSRWGKGLKQSEEQQSRIQEFLHESSKPLARYKDDQDLDQQLRDVERLEDPMLEYMRKKTKDRQSDTNREVYPVYKGPYPINRFNIRPGYRWDGVDRSNGYEKRYFDTKSAKVANEEESYKWSTEDM